jgi:hypothetical protein
LKLVFIISIITFNILKIIYFKPFTMYIHLLFFLFLMDHCIGFNTLCKIYVMSNTAHQLRILLYRAAHCFASAHSLMNSSRAFASSCILRDTAWACFCMATYLSSASGYSTISDCRKASWYITLIALSILFYLFKFPKHLYLSINALILPLM